MFEIGIVYVYFCFQIYSQSSRICAHKQARLCIWLNPATYFSHTRNYVPLATYRLYFDICNKKAFFPIKGYALRWMSLVEFREYMCHPSVMKMTTTTTTTMPAMSLPKKSSSFWAKPNRNGSANGKKWNVALNLIK